MRALGLVFLVGCVPLLLVALRWLAERDYVAGGLAVFAAAAVGHLGLELVALAEARERVAGAAPPSPPENDA